MRGRDDGAFALDERSNGVESVLDAVPSFGFDAGSQLDLLVEVDGPRCRCELGERQVRAEQRAALLGSLAEQFVGPCGEGRTVVRPPCFDLVVWAVHPVDASDSLLSNAQCRGKVEVNNRRRALEVEPFVHRIRAQRDCSCRRTGSEELLDTISIALVAPGCDDGRHLRSVDERFE